jgi:alkanesulfonate monooxygenase
MDYGRVQREVGDFSRKANDYGIDLWVIDHLLHAHGLYGMTWLEPMSVLTWAGAVAPDVKLGTGILVLPLRNPVALAKQLSSMDQFSGGRLIMGMASGWYKREFDAMGIPFNKRGKLMDENLEILNRLWTEPMVDGKYLAHEISAAVMYPKPRQQPRMPILIGGYVDKVLQRAATAGDGWLTYFYSPEAFTKSWDKIRAFAKEGGKDPDKLLNASQLPIMVGPSKGAVHDEMMDWLNKEWDFPEHSDCSRDSAIMGSVDECVEQLKAHLAVGVQKIIFVPYKYRMDQVETIARDIIPRLKTK